MLYKYALAKGEDVYITEKHRTIGPMLVDLDFRFDPVESHEKPVRTYTTATIDAFANLLGSCVSHYADKETFDIFVLEKPSGPTSIKSLVKDGLHFQIPDIVTRPGVQYVVCADVLKGMPAVLDHLNLVNRYEDVLDESIIERNDWLMYMSKKPGSCPYLVTRVLRYRASDKVLQDVTADTQLDAQSLMDRFSIQNKFEETPIREERLNDVIDHEQQMQEKRKRRELVQTVLTNQPVTSNNICENLEVVCKLVDILDASRGESYNDWVRVGWCLRNIDHRLLDKWIEFSRRSPKYVEGECARMWTHMRMGGLGMGTLHIQHHVSGTHYDIARVVHHMYRYEYVCSSLRNRTWYEFRNHLWHYSDSACSLRKRLSTDVFNEYAQCALYHQHKAVNGDSEQEAQKRNVEMCNKLNAIALKLKTTNFKDNIIKECCELFYHEKFEEKLDSNCGLIGFLNGVYDLENSEFREGRPDDYISYTTGINYVPFSEDLPQLANIKRFWSQVLPKDDIREYVLTLLSSFLSGHTREERFHIWMGSGCNGKSLSVELFDKALGDYTCKFPVTLLTQKRAASNAATSEIARAKGRRFACLQEPSEDERLNIGLLKELTGGDKVQARALYKEPVEFKPQWHIALLCNHLPHVPSDDGGTWRRIRVVEFTSKFVEFPKNANEFPIDLELSEMLDEWKEPFMSLLIEYYKTRYAKKKIKEPDAVLACTREYQKNNDHFADFVDTCIEKTSPSGVLRMSDAFSEFRSWVKDDNIPIRVPKKKDVQKYLDRALGKPSMENGDVCYRGFSVRDRGGGFSNKGGADYDD
ncbi:putative helicase [Tetrabaena socialis]|uniref:Putative helicase n=1 Tax=Tetrabaena socialis TaxID=47790 RepID=A0A2J7ZLY8_9CHLO|nr:putative helicase [Tetrabaena socialis]|eukprot:PNH01270.1 putative helicase [Tetrabaena socialis]